jgi:hypothetical protein
MRIAFDIGGVLSKYPGEFKRLLEALWVDHTLHVITDMHDKEDVLKQLRTNGFDESLIPTENVHCADYAQHGELCKAVLLRDLKISMFYDDFIGYTMWPPHFGPAPIRCLIMPDGYKPYWHEDWKNDGGDFGRRVYKEEK